MAIQVAGQEKPKAPAQKNENGDENQQAKKMYLKERLTKIGDFDESKEKPCLFACFSFVVFFYPIFGILIHCPRREDHLQLQ